MAVTSLDRRAFRFCVRRRGAGRARPQRRRRGVGLRPRPVSEFAERRTGACTASGRAGRRKAERTAGLRGGAGVRVPK